MVDRSFGLGERDAYLDPKLKHLSRELLVCFLTPQGTRMRGGRSAVLVNREVFHSIVLLKCTFRNSRVHRRSRGGISRYCSCSFFSISVGPKRAYRSIPYSRSLIKNGSPPRAFRIADARERLCTRALTIGTDTRLMLTRPFLIKNCLANSRHPQSEIIDFLMIWSPHTPP